MSSSASPNSWLRKAIAEFQAQNTEKEINRLFELARKKNPSLDKQDFIWDSAICNQLEINPVLKTYTEDMPLSTRIKDILKANYIDALVVLVQITRKELWRLPGLTESERGEIVSYLHDVGLALDENEDGTIKAAWEECFSRRRIFQDAMQSLDRRLNEVLHDNSLGFAETIREQVRVFEETDAFLVENHADKGTKQRFLWKYANFLYDHMSTCPEETGGATGIAKRELSLKEYLFGPEHKSTAESLRLVGNIYHEIGEVGKAIPYYKKDEAILEKDPGTDIRVLADLNHALGICQLDNKEYDSARETLNKAFKGYSKLPGGPDKHMLENLCYLIADTYKEQGDKESFCKYVDLAKFYKEDD